MYEDDPQEKVFDVLGQAVFGSDPLGRAIIGRAAGDREHPGVDEIAALPRVRYAPGERRDRRRRRRRPRRARRRSPRARAEPDARARERERLPRAPSDATARPTAVRAQGHRAVPRLPRAESGSPATTTAASRCACSTRSSAARRPRGSSRRSASAAASPTRSTRSPAPTRTPARSVCTSARGRTTSARRCAVIGAELHRLREEPGHRRELARAKENLKGRVRAGARVDRRADEPSRLRDPRRGAAALDRRGVERIEAVTLDDLRALVERAVVARAPLRRGHRPGRGRVQRGARRPARARVRGPRVIRVAVAGAAGRMGETVCARSTAREDMELVGRADPALGRRGRRARAAARRAGGLHHAGTAVETRAQAVAAGVHVVIGTTGFDRLGARRPRLGRERVRRAPNFAIGAVLMMRFAAEAARAHGAGGDHRAPPRPQARRARAGPRRGRRR